MDQRKPRRRTKWLSKVLGRETSVEGSGATASKQTVPIRSTSQRVEPPRDKASTRVTSTETLVPPAQVQELETKPSPVQQPPIEIRTRKFDGIVPSSKVVPKPPRKTTKQGAVKAAAPSKAQQLSSTKAPAGVLAAPTASSDNAHSTSTAFLRVPPKAKAKTATLLDSNASMRSAKLWEKAYNGLLREEEHKGLMQKYERILGEGSAQKSGTNFPDTMNNVVQEKIKVMKQKQWVIQWDQKSIVVRDQAERIVGFVQKFTALGNAVAQLDPVHAGIPWAGVCTILTLVMSDVTQHQAVLDGLEEISTIIAKYIAIEDVYVQTLEGRTGIEGAAGFELAIIKVYSCVLQYQIQTALHFHRKTMARTAANVIKLVDWNGLLTKIRYSDEECVRITSMTSMANMTSSITSISNGLAGVINRWDDINRINESLEKMQESWDAKQVENAKIISWVSDIHVGEDHERVRTKLGARYWQSGQWFFRSSEYRTWKKSSRGQFWLQGSVGTGKTSLASIVVNELIKTGDGQSVAFFYCSRGLAASSNDPTAIFRSLVAQLSCTSDGEDVHQVIKNWYKRDAKRFVTGSRLSLDECKDLMNTLMGFRGDTIIVVDGLDECSQPNHLLRALQEIWEKYPRLKLFLTSRLDVDVGDVFPNIITVRSDFGKTSEDIQEYIRKELERPERRNPKVITDELAERMVAILTQRAQGMFRWIELQLDLLISSERRIKFREDFTERLRRLEAGSGQEVLDSLRETYDDIYERNTQVGLPSRKLAEKSLKWILCAARPLKIWELGAAVSVAGQGLVATEVIVDICSNFFIVDARGFVQLAHLSVREYLEVKSVDGRFIFSPEEAHAEAALTCLLYWKVVSGSTREPGFEFTEDEDEEEKETIEFGPLAENTPGVTWGDDRKVTDVGEEEVLGSETVGRSEDSRTEPEQKPDSFEEPIIGPRRGVVSDDDAASEPTAINKDEGPNIETETISTTEKQGRGPFAAPNADYTFAAIFKKGTRQDAVERGTVENDDQTPVITLTKADDNPSGSYESSIHEGIKFTVNSMIFGSEDEKEPIPVIKQVEWGADQTSVEDIIEPSMDEEENESASSEQFVPVVHGSPSPDEKQSRVGITEIEHSPSPDEKQSRIDITETERDPSPDEKQPRIDITETERDPSPDEKQSRFDITESERDPIQAEADRAYRETVMARKIASQAIGERSDVDSVVRGRSSEKEEEPVIRIETPPGMERREKSPYDAPNADFFKLTNEYNETDDSPSLKPRQAFKRFQRYACIYWATHCKEAKMVRIDESSSLNEAFWEFLEDDGLNPAFQRWAQVLLNETMMTSTPVREPAPLLFIPTTAHDRAILEVEPMYERWQETIAPAKGPCRLLPSIPLIACFYGFLDVLGEISENGEAQMVRNHSGVVGLVLAARNGCNEVFDLPVSKDFDLDVRDSEGKTPLHHAAMNGYTALARFLLGYGKRRGGRKGELRVDVNARAGYTGLTPLSYAKLGRHADIVKLLLAERAH